MYIKSIVIDGFKSYAQRTEIGPFDPQFNAITGLNGSGKSNILDSICFLLGLTNLSQVRAGNLQELVYKGGQAGVSKATVTITFDNLNKDQSPVGYESFDEIIVSRQIAIGGRNKYLINGSNALSGRVHDLFCSVQLNINNPHFLIMQGRITKVLNMKPPEILSMIEEAAGTRMYENKKTTAQKTIEKKDSKLLEIDEILEKEISPSLQKLRDERSSYIEYQKVSRELEFLTRLLVAYNYIKAEEQKQQSEIDLKTARESINSTKNDASEIKQVMADEEEMIKELYKEKSGSDSEGQQSELELQVESLSKDVALAESTLKDSQHHLTEENKNCNQLKKSLAEDQDVLSRHKEQLLKCQQLHESLQQKLKDATSDLVAAQNHLQAVSSGLSSNPDGQSDTLAAQKIAKENEIGDLLSQINQLEMKLTTLTADLKEKRGLSDTDKQSYLKDKSLYDKVKKEILKLESSLSELNYDESELSTMKQKREVLKSDLASIRAKIDSFELKFPMLQFRYKDPYDGFDRTTVKGPVAKLFEVDDASTCTALEVVSGNKLYNVVVDTAETGKHLLQNGQLERHCTIIPLNKIIGKSISNDKVKSAQKLVGPEKVRSALSLIHYGNDLKPAMEFVFGGSFVCDTLEIAKKVSFKETIMTKSVSLSGDIFDPSGILTGGSRPQVTSMLVALQEILKDYECLQKKIIELEELDSIISQLEELSVKYNQIKEVVNGKIHEAETIKAKMEQSGHHQHLSQLQSLEETVANEQSNLNRAKSALGKARKDLEEIESKIENLKGLPEQELKEAENKLAAAKARVEEASSNAHANGQEKDTLQLEVADLESSMAAQLKQIDGVLALVEELEMKVGEDKAHLDEKNKLKFEAIDSLNKHKAVLKEKNKELHKHEKQLKELQAKLSECLLKIKENEHKMSSCIKENKEAAMKVESLLSKYDWIATEKDQFGLSGSAYDFNAFNVREANQKCAQLNEQKTKLSKNVNMRAMNMLGKAEEKYNDLKKKKKIVESDKAKITELIYELDQKKNETLVSAWEKVNKDFGSIFSTLLPGASCKLCPPDGMTVLDGLEVKVAFGDVWKESLTELSGGQRSLVALSLILSLLLFKPAPLYILDEVDAALDLSHTQNIGQMLRNHFRTSQFIVVSLKSGMFDNANVLFKTKFVDGVSTVERYINPQLQGSRRQTDSVN